MREARGCWRQPARSPAVRRERRLRAAARWVADEMSGIGMAVGAEQVLITTGSQQALDLVGKVLIDPGSRVRWRRPPTWARCRPSPRTSPIRAGRCDDEARCRALGRRAAARACCTRCPTSRTRAAVRWVLHARRRCWEPRRGLPMVEDNPYGDLWFDDHRRRRSPRAGATARSTSAFSKVLAPGLRLGYVVAPRRAVPKLLQAKQAADLHTRGLNQRVVLEVIENGFLASTCRRCATSTSSVRGHAGCDGEHFPIVPPPAAGTCRPAACSSGSSCRQLWTPSSCCAGGGAGCFCARFAVLRRRGGGNTLRLSFVTVSPQRHRHRHRRLGPHGALSRALSVAMGVYPRGGHEAALSEGPSSTCSLRRPLRGNPLAVVHDAAGPERHAHAAEFSTLDEPVGNHLPAAADRCRRPTTGCASSRQMASCRLPGTPRWGSCRHAWLAAGGVPRDAGMVVQQCEVGLVPGAAPVRGWHSPRRRCGCVADHWMKHSTARIPRGAVHFPKTPCRPLRQWVDNGPGWCAVCCCDSAERVLALAPRLGLHRAT